MNCSLRVMRYAICDMRYELHVLCYLIRCLFSSAEKAMFFCIKEAKLPMEA